MFIHPAVAAPVPEAPLDIFQLPTLSPKDLQIRVRVEWTASTPWDMHQADICGLKYPHVLGFPFAGTVVETGRGVSDIKLGDTVFGCAINDQRKQAHQVFLTLPRHRVGRIPANIRPEVAATVADSVIAAFHSLNTALGLALPWPRPDNFIPPEVGHPILIWGAATPIGQHCVQILKYWNYAYIFGVASPQHHEKLRRYGATYLFDINLPGLVQEIATHLRFHRRLITLDCIGSQIDSVEFMRDLLNSIHPATLTRNAVILPLHAPNPRNPTGHKLYTLEARQNQRGVNFHGYDDANAMYKACLLPLMIPDLLEKGVLQPNEIFIIEKDEETGEELDLLHRARKGLEWLRKEDWEGMTAVWRLWRQEEYPQFESGRPQKGRCGRHWRQLQRLEIFPPPPRR